MKLVSDRELLAVRMEVAVSICAKFPTMYKKVKEHKAPFGDDVQHTVYCVLTLLLEVEPVIDKVLGAYYKCQ